MGISMEENYIKEIAEALSENHAALMVGAGFSKNAEKIAVTEKKFLNWNELSDMFYETVYGQHGGPGKEYNSSLRLAQEVEITVGRPKLEKIIKEAVPDSEYAPSELYVKLMELPWKDVFTTNYDTLLERAADRVIKRRYDVVVCQEDLVNRSDAPRILKLHGSFPSYRPFIITEEDYRTYPIKFAAMVNTVQQALLENVFCMIGFSCEDPNFINWVGWIHDNLGKSSSQKIYMVSVSHMAEAKRKLLFERNIIVVDLQELWPDKDVGERLGSFLEILKIKAEEKRKKNNWFRTSQIQLNRYNATFKRKTRILKELNESYPDWIFLPWKLKNRVDYVLREVEKMYKFEELSFMEQVNFMYEYVKFMDISGRPISSTVADLFWDTLEKNVWDEQGKEVRDVFYYKVQTVYLQLLRAFRELAEWEKYDMCHGKINRAYMDYDSKQFLYACDWWKTLFQFQPENLAVMLDKWDIAKGDVYWPLVKAGMYALVGEISKADTILTEVLVLVRKQLVKDSGSEYLNSIEESIVSLINFVRQGNIGSDSEECIHKGEVSWWNTNSWYCLNLNTEEKDFKNFETKYEFDLSVTYTMHMGRDNSSVFYAMEYLRFLEQTGHPFRLQNVVNTEGLHGTIVKLAPYYPYWCLLQILFAQDKKHIDIAYGRVELSAFTQEEADAIAREYLRIFQIVMDRVKPENFFFAKSVYEHSAVVLPEIIARFCYKCSDGVLDEILDTMLAMCMSNVRANFKGIGKVLKGLLHAYGLQGQKERIGKILEFPIERDRFSEYYDPVNYLYIPKEKYILDSQIYHTMMFHIKQVIETEAGDIRDNAIDRLRVLARVVVLEKEDKEYLCNLMKSDVLKDKALLYLVDSEKYKKNVQEIFEDTLEKMKTDTNMQIFSSALNNYEYLINVLEDVDIREINLIGTFQIMENLVQSHISWIQSGQHEAEERIRQSFLIAVGLLILQNREGISLSRQEEEQIGSYFAVLKEIGGNIVILDMIESCFLGDGTLLEDFRKNIWLCDNRGLEMLKDYFDMLFAYRVPLEENKKISSYSEVAFQVSVYKIVSNEILHCLPAVELCYSLLLNGVFLEFELQLLVASLPKFEMETTIISADSEQEALGKLACRIRICQIAKELYMRGIKDGNIEQWKKISENNEEFIEIRKIHFENN